MRLSDSQNPRRKLRLTWEMVHNGQCWIGINTQNANRIAHEAIAEGRVRELAGYEKVRREVPYGANSRIDLLLESQHHACYIEVKNVTLVDSKGRYAFPDAVTVRGRKHLVELQGVVAQGHRAVMLYVIQRGDGAGFAVANDIDSAYAQELHRAMKAGVEVLAYQADVSPESIELTRKIAVCA